MTQWPKAYHIIFNVNSKRVSIFSDTRVGYVINQGSVSVFYSYKCHNANHNIEQ